MSCSAAWQRFLGNWGASAVTAKHEDAPLCIFLLIHLFICSESVCSLPKFIRNDPRIQIQCVTLTAIFNYRYHCPPPAFWHLHREMIISFQPRQFWFLLVSRNKPVSEMSQFVPVYNGPKDDLSVRFLPSVSIKECVP